MKDNIISSNTQMTRESSRLTDLLDIIETYSFLSSFTPGPAMRDWLLNEIRGWAEQYEIEQLVPVGIPDEENPDSDVLPLGPPRLIRSRRDH